MIIKKSDNNDNKENVKYACPVCHRPLIKKDENYFCSECLLVYPVIQNIPLLTLNNSILFTQY